MERTARSFLVVVVLVALPWAFGGCISAHQNGPDADSETHFLTDCDDSCEDGLECICGVCSVTCAPARDCGDIHPDAVCLSSESFAQDAECASAEFSVCDVVCDGDADCASVGGEHRCVEGQCRGPNVDDPDPGDCEDGTDRCFDGCTDLEGNVYMPGEVFGACDECTCTDTGDIECAPVDCAPPCTLGGAAYALGEEFVGPDCAECVCDTDGITCAFAPGGCGAMGCVVDGAFLEVGQSVVIDDGCSCTCAAGGEAVCDGPTCASACEVDGVTYAVGDSIPSSDRCEACTCDPWGMVSCLPTPCPPPPSYCELPFEVGDCDAAIPVYYFDVETGQCQPEVYGGCGGNDNRFGTFDACRSACGGGGGEGYTHCLIDGVEYGNGALVPDPFSCNTCACEEGALVACTEADCPEPCPAGTTAGSDCMQCGPVGGCALMEIGCFDACVDNDDQCQDPLRTACNEDALHCTANLICF